MRNDSSRGSIDVPLSYLANRDRNDVADVDREPIDVTGALHAFEWIEEHQPHVPAIGARAADWAALDVDDVEFQTAADRFPINEVELEGVGGGVVHGPLLR